MFLVRFREWMVTRKLWSWVGWKSTASEVTGECMSIRPAFISSHPHHPILPYLTTKWSVPFKWLVRAVISIHHNCHCSFLFAQLNMYEHTLPIFVWNHYNKHEFLHNCLTAARETARVIAQWFVAAITNHCSPNMTNMGDKVLRGPTVISYTDHIQWASFTHMLHLHTPSSCKQPYERIINNHLCSN